MKAIVLGLLTLALGGCVPYPVYKTLQPEASLAVFDEQGQPLAETQVLLIASAWPYGTERKRNAALSDTQGQARFEKIAEWRVESLMLHGAEHYFWNWCVQRPGYLTWHTGEGDLRFEPRQSVRLHPGVSSPCPPARARPH